MPIANLYRRRKRHDPDTHRGNSKIRCVADILIDAALWTLLYLWLFKDIAQAGHVFRFAMWLMTACMWLTPMLIWWVWVFGWMGFNAPRALDFLPQAKKPWQRWYANAKTALFVVAVVWMGHTVLGVVFVLTWLIFNLTIKAIKKES